MKNLITLFLALVLSALTANAQYCTPTYTTGPTAGDFIQAVQLGTINSVTGAGNANGYNNYTTISTNLNVGQSYSVTVVNSPTFTEDVAIWIDFNNNQVFDAAEKLGELTLAAGATAMFPFTVPATAVPGATRMRVKMEYFAANPIDPCTVQSTFGETEDYGILIIPASANDVGVSAITTPASGCGLSATETVCINVANFGTNSQSNIPVSYSINGGPAVTGVVAGPLTQGQIVNYCFTVTGNFSTPGNYTVQAWTSLPGDAVAADDTSTAIITNPTINAFPFQEDFETWGLGTPGTYLNGWTNGAGTMVWSVNAGGTSSLATGPLADHTLGTPAGKYIYLETSTGATGAFAEIISTCIDASALSAPSLSFWYHMHGATMGTLQLDVYANGVWNTNFWSLTGQQQVNQTDPWLQAVVPLAAFGGANDLQLRFVGVRGTSFTGDMALDDIELFQPIPSDAGTISVSGVSTNCGLTAAETIMTEIVNFGTSNITSVNVSYTLNGGTPTTELITGINLPPGDTLAYTFTAPADLSVPGLYNIAVYTTLTGDTNNGNDTTTIQVTNIPTVTTFPYFQDFESGQGGWVDGGTNNTWSFGTPNHPTINTAGSGVNSWVNGFGANTPAGQYLNNDNSYVQGPCYDFSTLANPIVRMKVWWESEFSWDGAVLQSSTDGGATWQNVGAFGDPDNWYTDNSVVGLNWAGTQEAWSGRGVTGSAGWVIAKHFLSNLGGLNAVLLRIAFGSDGSVQGEGFAFDDVEIYDAPPFDIGVLAAVRPISGCGLGALDTVELTYSNFGSANITSVDFVYSINGGTPVVETYTGTIIPGDTANYVFQTPVNLSATGTYTVDVYAVLAGDGDNTNDTLAQFTVIHKTPVSSYPWFEDFETFTVGVPGTLANGWEQDPDDGNQEWYVDAAGTPTFNTGPTVDHTLGTTLGKYMYVEDTGFDNDMVNLLTPCLDLTGMASPQFSFWYHSNDINAGSNPAVVNELHLDIQYQGLWINDVIIPITHKNNVWNQQVVDLTPYIGSVVGFRFRVNNNNNFGSNHDIAIDDVGLIDLITQDVGMTDLVLPNSGCGLSNAEFITAKLANFGSDTVFGGFNANYTINGGAVVTEPVTDTLAPGDTILYTFLTTGDFSAPSTTYNLDIYTTGLTGDTNLGNDTTYEQVINQTIGVFTYTEDFENFMVTTNATGLTGGWSTSPSNTTAAHRWTPDAGGTPSTATGPTVDHTLGTSAGIYMYTETSNGLTGDTAVLVSPCIDFSNVTSPKVSFWYHMHGATMGTLRVDVSDNGVWTNNVFSLTGQQQVNQTDPWLQAVVDLTPFAGSSDILIRWHATRGTSFTGDLAIDDINIFQPIPQDAGIDLVTGPLSGCGLSASETVSVDIINDGTANITSVMVSFQLNGGPVVTETYTGTITPGSIQPFTFSATADLSVPATYTLKTWTTLAGDTNFSNDTSEVSILNIPSLSTYPYFQDFESGNGGWQAGGSASTWTFGTPAHATINSAGSGVNSWVNGNGATTPSTYMPNDQSYVQGPCFDFTNLFKPIFEALVWWNSEFSWDGAVLQTSTDAGTTWETVGNFGDPDNWYTDNSVFGINWTNPLQEAWSGQGTSGSGGWVTAKHELDGLGGQPSVLIRIAFGSDGSVQGEGFAFDDVEIYEGPPFDAGIASLVSPNTSCGLSTMEQVMVEIGSYGSASIVGFDVNYSINGGPTVTETVNTAIPPTTTLVYTFAPFEDLSVPGNYSIAVWTSNLAMDSDPSNDMLTVLVENIPTVSTYPYLQDFESGQGGWSAGGTNSTWDFGTPISLNINTAGSGVNSWINGNNATPPASQYLNSDNSYVNSPCFDLTSVAVPQVRLKVAYDTENSWDGALLQATTDFGATWTNIGAFGDPNNWYNDNSITGLNWATTTQQGWTGLSGTGSGAWLVAENELTGFGGQPNVRLRIAFGSDPSVQDQAFAFDDVEIYDLPPDDLGITALYSPTAVSCGDSLAEIYVIVYNYGSEAQWNYTVGGVLTGFASGSYSVTVPDTIVPLAFDTIFLGTFNSLTGGNFSFTGYSSLVGDTANFNDTLMVNLQVNSGVPPIVADVSNCEPDSFILSAANGDPNLLWYDTLGNAPIAMGPTFTTPFLTTNTTYYVGYSAFSADTLLTSFVGGNGQSGNMFNIIATQNIVIDSFDINSQTTGPVTVEVYYKAGTHVGFEANATAWTLLGTAAANGAGAGLPTRVGIGGLNVPANTTYALYVTLTTGTIGYTNGTAVGNVWAQNSDLTVFEGVGIAYPYAGTFTPRNWNGVIHYSTPSCLNPSPIVPINAVILPAVSVDLGPDAFTCAGVVVDAATTGIISYQWSTGETSAAITVDTTGSYYVTAVDTNGCVSSDTINLNILPSPSVDLGADTASCGQYTIDAGNAGSTFVWSNAQTTQSVTVFTSGTYYVSVTNAQGCTDNDTVVVTINQNPAPDLGPDFIACDEAVLDGGAGFAGYMWSNGATTQTITVTTNGTYSVTVTNAAGCTGTDDVLVTVSPSPNVDLGPDFSDCDQATLNSGVSGASYNWSTGGNTQSITVTASGTYSVEVTDAFGCVGRDTVDVTIDTSPSAAFTTSGNPSVYVQFVDQSTGSAPLTYSWDFGDGNTSTSANPLHQYATGGAYTVTLTVTNACGSNTTFQVVNATVGISDDLFANSLSVYPNPSQGRFTVAGEGLDAEALTISILDVKGSLVYTHAVGRVVNGFAHEVDIRHLSSGIYLLKVSDGERTVNKKIVLE